MGGKPGDVGEESGDVGEESGDAGEESGDTGGKSGDAGGWQVKGCGRAGVDSFKEVMDDVTRLKGKI